MTSETVADSNDGGRTSRRRFLGWSLGGAGAVAAAGMAWAQGATNRAARNSTPTTTAVRPVRPPDATPDALSM